MNMRNFKILIGFLVITLLLVGGSIITAKFLSPTDTWVCDNGEWIKKGNPNVPMPLDICEKKVENKAENEKDVKFEDLNFNYGAETMAVVLAIPESWNDKYEAIEKEEDDGVKRIIFNYLGKNNNNPLLFIISSFPGTLDVYSVENQPNNRIIAQSENNYFTVSMPSDVPFESNEDDYDSYLKMNSEVDAIINNSVCGGTDAARTEEISENNQEEKWNIQVSFARIVSLKDTFGTGILIRNKVDELIANFKNNLFEWDDTGAPEESYSSLWLNYRLLSVSNHIIALEFYGLENFRGAAYPNGFSFSINYDLASSKEILLGDLFKVSEGEYLEKIATLVKADLAMQFKAKGFETDTLMFNDGTNASPSNYKNFNLLDDKIVFNFDTNHVGPRGIGSFKSEISRGSLNDILKN